MNFWQKITKPIIGLSPMDGVTDAPFRYINAKYGKPDVIITEFVSIDGITHFAEKMFDDFLYHPIERPVVAQIFGNDPDLFYQVAQVVAELGFDGLDINMGCPAKSVSGRGAGAGLIKNPKLAQQIILAAKQGISDWVQNGIKSLDPKLQKLTLQTKHKIIDNAGEDYVVNNQDRVSIPVSVKTRIGFDKVVVADWIENLLAVAPACITLHGRTLKQMYAGKADWASIATAAKITSDFNQTREDKQKIIFLGNGDLHDPNQIVEHIRAAQVDGVLIGRASLGNPWIFDYKKQIKQANLPIEISPISLPEIIKVALEHTRIHEKVKSAASFVQMRKHLAWYIKGFANSSQVRMALMQATNSKQVEIIFKNYLDNLSHT